MTASVVMPPHDLNPDPQSLRRWFICCMLFLNSSEVTRLYAQLTSFHHPTHDLP